MTLTRLLIPTYVNLLNAASGWLTKAQGHGTGAQGDALLSARLATDMFPLSTQIRFACVQPYEAVARLTGGELPARVSELLNEGRSAGDTPGSIADAQDRIAETLSMLSGLADDALDRDPDSLLVHSLPNGMTFDLTAEQYARDWAIPQFYFHLMAAYAILRSRDVPLGKIDYVGHMLPFLRS